MPDEAIDDRLRAVLARARLPIDDECGLLLERLVADGAARVRDAGDADIAVQHLRELLDDMTQQSRILRFDGLHAPNLHSALERLCPLWPFC